MKNYTVEIRAVVRKIIPVEADNATGAEEKAHELFDVAYDEYEVEYDQSTLNCDEVEECGD